MQAASVMYVADAARSAAFCEAMRGATEREASLAIDAEWRPDNGGYHGTHMCCYGIAMD